VNLLDGDARTIAFTVATRNRTSVYRRLGGTRMALLIAFHPVRVLRMGFQAAAEWLREEWERAAGELAGRATHAEGIFPFVRILSNVVVRELQTMAILLDVYLGVPVIYSTFMQYDELAHHFGPSSPQALGDLRRTDARIAEIERMIRLAAGRPYDLVLLSDHGMTPSASYRVRFGESLASTVQGVLDAYADRTGEMSVIAHASYAVDSEYADVGPRVVDTLADVAARRSGRRRRALRRVRDWLRRHYGLRELVFPEKYRVDPEHDVVVTYSSCLAHLYFADDPRALEADDVRGDARRAHLYEALLEHPGVGLIAMRDGSRVRLESRTGSAVLEATSTGEASPNGARVDGATLEVTGGENPMERYGVEPYVLRSVYDLVRQPNAGDLVLFGAYDGYDIVSFDDQVGAHGSAGGDQVYPFLLTPPTLDVRAARLENARDIHRVIMTRYAIDGTAEPQRTASPT
jgi:hypothetical protein